MFDLTSSKLLILAVVALIVVGPKDLPALLRTVGKYMGLIRRQANEFRAQFEEAMRETELAELKKEVEDLGREAKTTLDDASRTVETHMGDVSKELNESLAEVDRAAAAQPALIDTPSEAPLALDATTPPEPAAIEPPPEPVAPPAAKPREMAEAGTGTTPRSGA